MGSGSRRYREGMLHERLGQRNWASRCAALVGRMYGNLASKAGQWLARSTRVRLLPIFVSDPFGINFIGIMDTYSMRETTGGWQEIRVACTNPTPGRPNKGHCNPKVASSGLPPFYPYVKAEMLNLPVVDPQVRNPVIAPLTKYLQAVWE